MKTLLIFLFLALSFVLGFSRGTLSGMKESRTIYLEVEKELRKTIKLADRIIEIQRGTIDTLSSNKSLIFPWSSTNTYQLN